MTLEQARGELTLYDRLKILETKLLMRHAPRSSKGWRQNLKRLFCTGAAEQHQTVRCDASQQSGDGVVVKDHVFALLGEHKKVGASPPN